MHRICASLTCLLIHVSALNYTRTCSHLEGVSFDTLALQSEYEVSDLVVNEIGENGTYTLSKCTIIEDNVELIFYGTQGEATGVAAFDCDAVFEGQACSNCDSCDLTTNIMSEKFLWYDCSGITSATCSQSNQVACTNQVGTQSHENCFIANPTAAPSQSARTQSSSLSQASPLFAMVVTTVSILHCNNMFD